MGGGDHLVVRDSEQVVVVLRLRRTIHVVRFELEHKYVTWFPFTSFEYHIISNLSKLARIERLVGGDDRLRRYDWCKEL